MRKCPLGGPTERGARVWVLRGGLAAGVGAGGGGHHGGRCCVGPCGLPWGHGDIGQQVPPAPSTPPCPRVSCSLWGAQSPSWGSGLMLWVEGVAGEGRGGDGGLGHGTQIFRKLRIGGPRASPLGAACGPSLGALPLSRGSSAGSPEASILHGPGSSLHRAHPHPPSKGTGWAPSLSDETPAQGSLSLMKGSLCGAGRPLAKDKTTVCPPSLARGWGLPWGWPAGWGWAQVRSLYPFSISPVSITELLLA